MPDLAAWEVEEEKESRMNGWTNRMPLALLVLCLVTTLSAQDITKGSISGVVRDASGAVVGGAKVTLNSPYGDRTTNTNASGEYIFNNLVPGSGYTVTVDKAGFNVSKTPGL